MFGPLDVVEVGVNSFRRGWIRIDAARGERAGVDYASTSESNDSAWSEMSMAVAAAAFHYVTTPGNVRYQEGGRFAAGRTESVTHFTNVGSQRAIRLRSEGHAPGGDRGEGTACPMGCPGCCRVPD